MPSKHETLAVLRQPLLSSRASLLPGQQTVPVGVVEQKSQTQGPDAGHLAIYQETVAALDFLQSYADSAASRVAILSDMNARQHRAVLDFRDINEDDSNIAFMGIMGSVVGFVLSTPFVLCAGNAGLLSGLGVVGVWSAATCGPTIGIGGCCTAGAMIGNRYDFFTASSHQEDFLRDISACHAKEVYCEIVGLVKRLIAESPEDSAYYVDEASQKIISISTRRPASFEQVKAFLQSKREALAPTPMMPVARR